MKIVIDIDDNLYSRLFDNGVDNYDDAVDMAKAIRKGTPLPKGYSDTLDKIRAEIEKESEVKTLQLHWGEAMGLNRAIEIINKYNGESEEV